MSSFDTLVSGDLIGAFVQTYTTGFLAPFEPFFYGFIVFMILGAIYMKTENLNMIATLGFLISAVTISGTTIFNFVPPAAAGMGYVVLVLALTITIFKLVKK